MPTGDPNTAILDSFVARLHESHEVSAYQAIERMIQAGESVGLHTDTLLRMLDQGSTSQHYSN